jgi:hypothetical protein
MSRDEMDIRPVGVTLSAEDINAIIADTQDAARINGKEVLYVVVKPDPEDAEFFYTEIHYKQPITRLRRITGYMSKLENFNSAKQAEARDRRPHD